MATNRFGMRWGLAGLILLIGSTFTAAAEIEAGLPANSITVLTVNFKQLLHAPVVKQHGLASLRQTCQNTDAIRAALEALGLDPFRDLDRLTVASVDLGEMVGGIAILRGRFDTARFHLATKMLAKEHGDRFVMHKDDDLKYISIIPGAHGSMPLGVGINNQKGLILSMPPPKGCLLELCGNGCFALLDKNTLVAASSEELLKETCKHIADKDTSSLNKPMRHLLAELESKQTIAFAGHRVPRTISAEDSSESQEEVSPSPLRDLTGSISLAEDFKLRCAVRAASADDARTVMKSFEELRLRADGLMTLLAGSSKEYAFLKDIPRSFLAVRKGRIILVEGCLPAETLAKLLGACSAKGR